MIGVVIAAHGELARALRATAEMILGPQEAVDVVSLMPGDAPELLVERLRAAIEKVGSEQGVVVLIDLLGGSPANAVAAVAAEYPQLQAVVGVNLPMVLEVFTGRDDGSAEDLARRAAENGKAAVIDLTALLREA